jgi:signal peptidase I
VSARPAPSTGEPPLRRLARAVLTRAVRGAGSHGGTWGEAILGEFEATAGRWEAIRWTASGIRVAWRERRNRRRAQAPTGVARWRWFVRGWRFPVVTATAFILVAALLRWFVVGVVYLPSASMEPTYRISDRTVVNKLAYRWNAPRRGDVVLVDGDRLTGGGSHVDLVRRVIGLPGDRITCQDGYFYRNGTKVDSPHAAGVDPLTCTETTIAADRLYLVGDNLEAAVDSRTFGTVPRNAVIGRVVTGLVWRGSGA